MALGALGGGGIMCASPGEDAQLGNDCSFHSAWEFGEVLGVDHNIEWHRVVSFEVAAKEVEGLFVSSFGDVCEEEACQTSF